VATQRSDGWNLEEVPLQLEKPENMDDRQFNRWAGGQQKRELKFDDTARRIKEAELLLEELKGPFLEEKKKREEAK
jgi:hypothetical protein